MEEKTIRNLIVQAQKAQERAYAPYSRFHVGAALLCTEGAVFTGCNIENASYPAGNCAERTAVFKAVSEGKTEFEAICIIGGPERTDMPAEEEKRSGLGKPEEEAADFCPPCGICRQVLAEFCDPEAFQVILAKSTDEYRIYTLAELLPLSFGRIQLRGNVMG